MFLISFCKCNWVRILVSLEEMALTNKDLDSEDEEMFLMLQRLNEMEKRLERFKMMEDALESKAHLVDGLTDRLVGLEHRTTSLETQLKEKQDEIVQLHDRIAKFQTALDVKEAEVKQLRQQLDDSQQWQTAHQDIQQLKSKLEQLTGALADRDARLVQITGQLGALKQTNDDLFLRIENLQYIYIREDEEKKLQINKLQQNVVSLRCPSLLVALAVMGGFGCISERLVFLSRSTAFHSCSHWCCASCCLFSAQVTRRGQEIAWRDG